MSDEQRDTPPTTSRLHRQRARHAQDEQKRRVRWVSGFTTFRDLLSFLVGTAIICHEVFLVDHADLYVIGVGVTFTGLPIVLGADERKSR